MKIVCPAIDLVTDKGEFLVSRSWMRLCSGHGVTSACGTKLGNGAARIQCQERFDVSSRITTCQLPGHDAGDHLPCSFLGPHTPHVYNPAFHHRTPLSAFLTASKFKSFPILPCPSGLRVCVPDLHLLEQVRAMSEPIFILIGGGDKEVLNFFKTITALTR